jgi:integrase
LLFPGRRDHQPLTTRQFGRLFKEAAKAAGLRKTVSPHSLRHYAESRIMPSTGSLAAEGRWFLRQQRSRTIPLLGIILIGVTGCSLGVRCSEREHPAELFM